MWWLSILLVIVIFIAVILIRTAQFKPKAVQSVEIEKVPSDRDKIVRDMVDMIRCKTVSYHEEELIDFAEFEKFKTLLIERFPLFHGACERTEIGKTGLLYKLIGKSSEKPSVCMAHYDVVPVEQSLWSKPAFEGIIENDTIWGRGTLDTKGTLCSIFEATEQLLSEGFQPENDMYFSFSGEEEIYGDTCIDIVSHLENLGIKPAIVLDEGGAVIENLFPGVAKECAVIGIAEKGGLNLKLSLKSEGGHSSTPPVNTITEQLGSAIVSISKKPFKRQLTEPVRQMFDTLGRESSFVYRLIFANLWCFLPVLDMICKKSGGEMNALLRTTVAVTRMEGSSAYNVLPPSASIGINIRLMGTDTVDFAVERLKTTTGNPQIVATVIDGSEASSCSKTDCEEWDKLGNAIRQTWTEAIVSPYLMLACSDSRHYCRISDRVYRFSAMKLSKEERGMIHGHDERLPIETLIKTVEFYYRFIKSL